MTDCLNWFDLFKLSGLDLGETEGDGVGRFTDDDKTLILAMIGRRANAAEAGKTSRESDEEDR